MKTIKESCAEFCKNLNSIYDEQEVFAAGVEFAQRWIPITESLPEHHPELLLDKVEDHILNCSFLNTKRVLVKFSDGSVEFIHRFRTDLNNFFWAYRDQNVIEWRPVEYK